ncbi:biotin-dependent carboxyltransferase family protein [Pseudomonas aeruginosa]|nr:biotin-dependent carboxyltransferase family protein [Pseudomonas aeruginosa]
MIEIISTGALNSVQDLGRTGHLSIGVARSGAMDRSALLIGNTLLGNERSAAGVEIALFPFKAKFHITVKFVVTGANSSLELDKVPQPTNWVCEAAAGQTLVINLPEKGARCYLCVEGGIDTPGLLGSRSTDLKSGLGGFEGRGLYRGDRLPVGNVESLAHSNFGLAQKTYLPESEIEIRVLPAAEYEEFEDSTLKSFFDGLWTVSQEANRMGIRLSGNFIKPKRPMEMLSHGILPGTIQVPPSGLPIIQLSDANTCGGYPKIANVIEADLCRLGQARVGAKLKFVLIDYEEAVKAQREFENWLVTLARSVSARLSF